MTKRAIYKNRFSVLADFEDRNGEEKEWQKEKGYPWGADADEKQGQLCIASLGTQ